MALFYGASIVAGESGFFQFAAGAPGQAGGSMLQVLAYNLGTLTGVGSVTPLVVADPNVTATSQIFLTPKTPGGTQAGWNITSITPGVGFSVTLGASDTTVYNYAILG